MTPTTKYITNFAGRNTQPKLEAIADNIIDNLIAYNKALKSKSIVKSMTPTTKYMQSRNQ